MNEEKKHDMNEGMNLHSWHGAEVFLGEALMINRGEFKN